MANKKNRPSVDETAVWKPLSWFKVSARNPVDHPPDQIRDLRKLMDADTGQTFGVLADEKGELIAGTGRFLAASLAEGDLKPWPKLKVNIARNWTPEQKRGYRIADNRISERKSWNDQLLRDELSFLNGAGFDLALTALTAEDLGRFNITGVEPDAAEAIEGPKVKLSDRFGVPPFSVMNAREGWWQARKAAWIALGIRSELGRGETAGGKLAMSETVNRLKPSADQARKRSRANAEQGGSKMPAANYSKNRSRGDGRGRAVPA